MRSNESIHALCATIAASALLFGCSQAVSEADFVKECVANNPTANEALCSCMHRETLDRLPKEVHEAMLLGMQGRKQEAEALMSNIDMDKRGELMEKQFEIVGACMGET
jgi:hypothetical protein